MIKGDLYQDDSMYTTLSVQYTKDVFNKVPELFILFNSVWSLASQIFSNIAVTAYASLSPRKSQIMLIIFCFKITLSL